MMNSLSLRYSFVFIVLSTLIATGCRQEYMSELDLKSYVADEDNGLTKSAISGSTKISVSLQPTDLLTATELRAKSQLLEEDITSARSKYSGQYYFILRLSRDGKELATPSQVGLAGFSDLLQTLSFGMAEKVSLVASTGDTLEVADFIYNRTYGAATSSDLLFAFHKRKPAGGEYLEFSLDDFGLGIEKQVFRFELDDIDSAPKIFKNKLPAL